MQRVRELVRAVPNFPKQGILFRDITPVLADGVALREVISALAARYQDHRVTHIAGIESRGFIFGTALAHAMGVGVVLVRKPGKLPRETHEVRYALEYGQDALQIHKDAVGKGDRVVIIDDLLATGGTAAAAAELVERCGADVLEIGVVIELEGLGGRQKVTPRSVHALLTY